MTEIDILRLAASPAAPEHVRNAAAPALHALSAQSGMAKSAALSVQVDWTELARSILPYLLLSAASGFGMPWLKKLLGEESDKKFDWTTAVAAPIIAALADPLRHVINHNIPDVVQPPDAGEPEIFGPISAIQPVGVVPSFAEVPQPTGTTPPIQDMLNRLEGFNSNPQTTFPVIHYHAYPEF